MTHEAHMRARRCIRDKGFPPHPSPPWPLSGIAAVYGREDDSAPSIPQTIPQAALLGGLLTGFEMHREVAW